MENKSLFSTHGNSSLASQTNSFSKNAQITRHENKTWKTRNSQYNQMFCRPLFNHLCDIHNMPLQILLIHNYVKEFKELQHCFPFLLIHVMQLSVAGFPLHYNFELCIRKGYKVIYVLKLYYITFFQINYYNLENVCFQLKYQNT